MANDAYEQQLSICGHRERGGVLIGSSRFDAVYYPSCDLSVEDAMFLVLNDEFQGIVGAKGTFSRKNVGVVSKCVGCKALTNAVAKKCPKYIEPIQGDET